MTARSLLPLVAVAFACLSAHVAEPGPVSSASPGPEAVLAAIVGEPPAQEGAGAPAPEPTAIAGVLSEWNPHLTPGERRRAARAVLRSSARYGLDPELVTAVILVESSARPWVRSPKGAVGLMQVMPYMARPLPVAGNLATIETNVEVGCRILADNIRRLGVETGVSAYFWGNQIKGNGYLRKVLAARDEVRRRLRS